MALQPGRVVPRLLGGVLPAAIAALLAVVAYYPAGEHKRFVYDDTPIIVENKLVTEAGPWYRFWLSPYWPKETSRDRLYRPLALCTYRLNTLCSADGRPNPGAFHLVNVVLHALTAAGVAVLAGRLAGPLTAGLLAGALFAVHPLHAEAVATGYGRCELLAGCFGVWLLVRHIRPAGPDHPRKFRFHLGSAVLFLAAIMSKEHALLLWPVILIIDLGHRRQLPPASRPPRREWLNKTLGPTHAGFMLAGAAFLALRCAVFGPYWRLEPWRVRVWENPLGHAGVLEHILTPFRLLWLVFTLLFQPQRLCPIWSVPALTPAGRLEGDVLAGMILAAALLLFIVIAWRYRLLAGVMAAGLLITLTIPTHALPLAGWFFAERWLYMPAIFIAVLAGVALARGGAIAVAAALAAALLLLPATWEYSATFRDDQSMQQEVVLRQPDNFQGRRNLAYLCFLQRRYPETIQAANEVIERFGPVIEIYPWLWESYLQIGDAHRALAAMDTYVRLKAPFPVPDLDEPHKRAQALIARQRGRAGE